MYFDTKNGPVYSPVNPELKSLFTILEKNEPALGGSRFFDDLVEAYQTLDAELKEETDNAQTIKAG
ncbi:hypothetical protein ABXS71_16990 [Bacillus infantis]|uniref:hypothetical protein n=1 Tax=Bacillus infantis TaxID=324767 RepID=UPI00344E8453